MARHEITFVGKDEGAGAILDTIKSKQEEVAKAAKATAEEIMRGNIAKARSAQEAIKMTEEEIRQAQRADRLHSESRKNAERARHQAAMGKKGLRPDQMTDMAADHSARMGAISQESREDKAQLDALKDILNELKTTRSSSERRDSRAAGRASTSRRMSDIQGDAASGGNVLNDVFNESDVEISQGIGLDGSGGRGPNKGNNVNVGGVVGGVGGAMGQSSAADMGMGGLSAIGGAIGKAAVPLAIAAGLYKGVGSVLTGAAERERQEQEALALSGTNRHGAGVQDTLLRLGRSGYTSGNMAASTEAGITREELFSIMGQAAKAKGTTGGGLEDMESVALNAALTRNAMSLDMPTVLQMLNLTRTHGGGDFGVQEGVFGALKGTGALGGGSDMSRMQPMMQAFLNLQQQQLQAGGATTSQGTLSALRMVAGAGGVFQNDEMVNQTLAGINQGLAGGAGTASGAMKMAMLRRMNPDMDLFDLQMRQNQGLESGMLGPAIDMARKSGGNAQTQKQMLFNLLGNDESLRPIIKKIIDDNLSLEEAKSQVFDIEGKGKDVVGKLTQEGLDLDALGSEIKEGIVQGLKSGFDYHAQQLEDIINGDQTFSEAALQNLEAQYRLIEGLFSGN